MGFGEPNHYHVWCPICDFTREVVERGSAWVAKEQSARRVGSCTMLVQCNTCATPILLEQEEYDLMDGDVPVEPERLWPEPVRGLNPVIPESLRLEQEQARKCFNAKAYTASVVMVRRTLEGICVANKIEKKQLFQALKELRDNGTIDSRLYEWAHELRVLGNEGAHYTGTQVERQDATDAIALSEAMLDYLYVLTAKFDEFKKRREARNRTGAPPSSDSEAPENPGSESGLAGD